MKTLFIGGIKSGKSLNAENYTLKNSPKKPIYLATNEFFDEEMSERIKKHKEQRADNFFTMQEATNLSDVIKNANTFVLVECISMWINNMLHHKYKEKEITKEIENIISLNRNIIFVINDVGCSVVAKDKLTRAFVDINGRISQLLASKCDEVYNTVAGISVKLK